MALSRLTIGGRAVGDGAPAFIIAEIGSNFAGSLDTAMMMIRESARLGADAVKFQSYTADTLVNRLLRPEAYTLIRSLELPDEWLPELKRCAEDAGVIFLCSPFSEAKADALERLDIAAYKIASGELTNLPFLRHVARKQKPVILSVGMADLNEVGVALDAIYAEGNHMVALLHCVVCYPSACADANIRAMVALRERFGLPVGYSDHSHGHVVPLGAVALGACVIETHVTFDNKADGPDHPFALEFDAFGGMVAAIRSLEASLGTGLKEPVGVEVDARWRARRGLYATRRIAKGEVIAPEDMIALRPSEGAPPEMATRFAGRRAAVDIDELEALDETKLEPSA